MATSQFLEARPGPLRNSAPRALPAGPPFPTLRTTPSRRTPIPHLRSRAYRKDKRDLQGSDRGDRGDQQDQREARLFQVHPAPLLRGPRSLVTTPPVERARDPGITTARTPPAARRAVFEALTYNVPSPAKRGLKTAHGEKSGQLPGLPGAPKRTCHVPEDRQRAQGVRQARVHQAGWFNSKVAHRRVQPLPPVVPKRLLHSP